MNMSNKETERDEIIDETHELQDIKSDEDEINEDEINEDEET